MMTDALGLGLPTIPKSPRLAPLTDLSRVERQAVLAEAHELVRRVGEAWERFHEARPPGRALDPGQRRDRGLELMRLRFPVLTKKELEHWLSLNAGPDDAVIAAGVVLLRLGHDPQDRRIRKRFHAVFGGHT